MIGFSHDDIQSPPAVEIPVPSARYSVMRPAITWVKDHPLVFVLAVFAVIVILEYASLPGTSEIALLRKVNPKTTALIEQRRDEARKRGKVLRIRQQWVPLSQMSDDLIHAVIIAEDGTFFEHEGIDWFEVKESIKKDLAKWRLARGGSTITQQLAKNLYLSTSKDPIRKLKEISITAFLENELPKNRILELYLNVIEWGDGVFGVEAAAMAHFGKHASALTRDEAASLAAVIPSPLRHRPTDGSRFVQFRKRIVLLRMDARGW